MILSKEQRAIIESDASHILVEAAAGSGKTLTLVERFKREIDNGTNPSKIVAITFTNNAAEEMRERLGNYAAGTFIGTIHSYANYLLLCAGIETRDLLDKEDFDELFRLVKENPHCVQEVDYLSCDESQDQTEEQYELILDIIKPKRWFIVGDNKQTIYQWNGASPETFISLKKNPSVTTYHLNNNYRCGSKILDYARGIIHLAGLDYEDHSISLSGKTGTVQDVIYDSSKLAQGIRGWNTSHNCTYGDWFVLCRTNEEIDYFSQTLSDYGIPHDTFKRKDLTRDELTKKLSENTVKVLTIHAAKGLEAPNVIVIGAKFYNTEEKCVAYVAATRAKDLLIWARKPTGRKKYETNYHTRITNWE